eukprot:Skav218377  [mRNA]  locus=scaffold2066:258439:265836:- [translate_table: standard]
MPVQFKFRGEKAFRSLLNVTTPCTLQRVRTAIYEQARISDSTTDLHLDDSTGNTLDPKVLLIQDRLVQVLVRRTPKAEVQLSGLNDLDALDDDDELAMDRVVQQHDVSGLGLSSSAPSHRFNRSYNAAASSTHPQRDTIDAERSGHYIFDHEASAEEKKRILGDTVQEKDALKCPLCHQLFRQARSRSEPSDNADSLSSGCAGTVLRSYILHETQGIPGLHFS